MKKISTCIVLAFAGLTLVLSSCNFSVGTNKNFNTGLSYSYNGFSVDDVLLVSQENVAMDDNKVILDSRVAIVIQGLKNYQLNDGKAFPGLSLLVTDKQNNEMLNEADLFADSNGYSEEDAAVLRGTVTVANPMRIGETYHLKMRVWDKKKPENELSAEVDIEVQ